MKKKWSANKKAAVICGGIVAAIVLFVTFNISVFQLIGRINRFAISHESSHHMYDDSYYDYPYDYDYDYDYDYGYGYDHDYNHDYYYDENDGNGAKEYPKEGYGNWGNSEYYELHDAVREDLSYQVEFDTKTELFNEQGNISLDVIYPVIYSKQEIDVTSANKAVQKELDVLIDYVESVSEWLGEDEFFSFEAESYVTYMDEEILSIAYVESSYINGEAYENYIVSVNIDMESQMKLTNTQILNVNDDFSVEFRNRCEKQNGEIASLYSYSDQDITQLLTTEENLIIFYTPLGMEIGFNYYYGWVTVTYPDYQQYQRKF